MKCSLALPLSLAVALPTQSRASSGGWHLGGDLAASLNSHLRGQSIKKRGSSAATAAWQAAPQGTGILIENDAAVEQCPVGEPVPLAAPHEWYNFKENAGACAQLVRAKKLEGSCGNIYTVKVAYSVSHSEASPCYCCKPVKEEEDCVACLAGAPTVGWQTRPVTSARAGWRTLRLADAPPRASTCSPRARAAWAAMAAYEGGRVAFGGPMQVDLNYMYMMQSAFWRRSLALSPANGTETDHVGLWDRGGECVLAFRGTDSFYDFANTMSQTPRDYQGITGVFSGVVKEFEIVFSQMKKADNLKHIRTTCSKHLTVSGHGLGGAVSQLFAALINKVGDPLSLGMTVDHYYGFGAMPFSQKEVPDDKSADGCFKGGLYYSMQKNHDHVSYIDILSFQGVQNGHRWLKAPRVLTWNYTEFTVVPCGEPMPEFPGLPPGYPSMKSPAQFALHDSATYVDNIGCKDNSGLEVAAPAGPEPIGPAGILLRSGSAIAECPSGLSVELATGLGTMDAEECAQLVRDKRISGVCGNIYTAKVGPATSLLRAPRVSSRIGGQLHASGGSRDNKAWIPGPVNASVCSCCQPVPDTNDCVTCMPGKNMAGWQTGPLYLKSPDWVTRRLADAPPKASTCDAAAVASWVAMEAYSSSTISLSFPYVANYAYLLQSAFWKFAAGWSAKNSTIKAGVVAENPLLFDVDFASLWVKGPTCVLAFRGSDSQVDTPMLPPSVAETIPGLPQSNTHVWGPERYHGMDVHSGVKAEFEAILSKLKADGGAGFAAIRKSCSDPITVTGHALGGAAAQLFAVLANKLGDPLKAGLAVSHVYGFGSMPFARGPQTNDRAEDGCFQGGVYVHANKLGDGTIEVDPATTMGSGPALGFRHLKSKLVILFGSNKTERLVTPCGKDPPAVKPAGSLLPLHDMSGYTDAVGCA